MSKSQKPQSRIQGRDSRTGEFIPVAQTYERPATTQRERVPLPGYGDTGRGGAGNKKSGK